MSSMLCEYVMIGREELMEGSKEGRKCIHTHTHHSLADVKKRGMYVCLYESENVRKMERSI